jgi:hypothetical protein
VDLYRKIGSAFHAIHNSFGSRLERLTMPQEQIDLLNLATAEVEDEYEALMCRMKEYDHCLDAVREWLEAPEYVRGRHGSQSLSMAVTLDPHATSEEQLDE